MKKLILALLLALPSPALAAQAAQVESRDISLSGKELHLGI